MEKRVKELKKLIANTKKDIREARQDQTIKFDFIHPATIYERVLTELENELKEKHETSYKKP